MEYIKGFKDLKFHKDTSVTVGKFEGIHRGHEYLVKKIVSDAKKNGRESVLICFDKSPRYSFGTKEERELKSLITNEERVYVLEHAGLDYIVELPFTEEVKSMEPEDFLSLLTDTFCMKYMTCGTDFTFGKMGRGNVALLEELHEKMGFDLEVVTKLKDVTRDISSSYVREEILLGNVKKANDLLGYSYFVYGEIVHGNHIGTKMKMPTINILPTSDKLLPPNGVYVSNVIIDGNTYQGISNIGLKPTVEEKEKHIGVETHIFDFDKDVYGKVAKVEFLDFLRPEKKFPSMEELSAQILRDIEGAKAYFS